MTVSRYTLDQLDQPLQAALTRLSLFASPRFASIWGAKRGHPVFWTAQQDTRTVAVLPGVEFGSGPLARFQAMPDGLPGRIVMIDCDHSEQPEVVEAILSAVQRHGYAKVFVTDFFSEYDHGHGMTREEQTAPLVDIAHDDWLPPDKTLVGELRKAEREGVVVQAFDVRRHLAPFIALLRDTERRLKIKARYPDPFYAALAELASTDNRVVWRIVEHEGTAVASHVYLVDGDTALYWIACLDKEHSFLKANQFMLYSQARAFAATGVVRLNLGQSPPEAESLHTFKDKWGARPYTYSRLTSQSLLGRIR